MTTIGDDAGIALEGGFDDLAAVDARQPQVRDDDVEREFAQQLERSFARFGLGHLEALLDEALGDHRSERRFVVYEE